MKVYTFFNCKWLGWFNKRSLIFPALRLGFFRHGPMDTWHNGQAVGFTLIMSFIAEFGLKSYYKNKAMVLDTVAKKDNTDGMIQNYWLNIIIHGLIPVHKETGIKEEDVYVSEPFYKTKPKRNINVPNKKS